ncbi:MAG TPA: tRNA preQ1(34) S-adenosylmethionine ribosyltransferase-isomerase QueA [Hyphomicrobium sp.]|nr:tRNA preQ1(34) S-adenosylmethionine ribosyltransferase-isomerase QueA [Hyphomicrobium sp.]
MRTELFDFELDDERIALRPASPRDSARLLAVKPGEEDMLRDFIVRDLPDLLAPGDALVFNRTRVIPAALRGVRIRDGVSAKISLNLMQRLDDHVWRVLARPAKRLEAGDRVQLGHSNTMCHLGALDATVVGKTADGEVDLAFDLSGPHLDAAFLAVGEMPLPPYIANRRTPDDADRITYQTVYATEPGAVAAPTAGLHFTDELLAKLKDVGVEEHFVTLHVGAGTFLPVKAEDTQGHKMHAEWGEVTPQSAAALNAVHARGGRIIAVGTTSLRLLESAANDSGEIMPFSGETSIFITPGYRFKAVDALMSNFHLPRSTLFMLVSAFCGLQTMQAAYKHAIDNGYRFYSYGDASLLFPARGALKR